MPSSHDDNSNTEERKSREEDKDDYPLKHLLDKPGIVLCEDVMKKYGKDNTLLLHELIHAYDDCRALINWSNCEQLACAEIRASALSGECDFKNERRRKNVDSKIIGGYQNCVRRRAALSLSMARACQNRNTEEIVDSVFKTCYNDVEPFARRP
jgi:inner membrane protease ATP23